ncbi:Protein Y71H2AM.9 [Aphelenchoides avenae]|nr:Protein Y71H2AM.9 [Aphelenchus avenae]
MAEFSLTKEQLRALPRSVDISEISSRPLYYVDDVRDKAIQIHGSEAAMLAKRRTLLSTASLTESQRQVLRMQAEKTANAQDAHGVVGVAIAMNTMDMLCKLAAAYVTGSKSLFAEAIHSAVDTANQLILMFGIRFSTRNPDPNFPYGFGNMRYVTSLISGCGILAFGCGLSMYHGISGLLHPTPLEPLTYAYYALAVSFAFQTISGLKAYTTVKRKAIEANMTMANYVRSSSDPSLNVVLLEDCAAVTGVMIAATAVSLSSIFETHVFDCCGSIAIGFLLGTAAGFIIRTNAAHLVGRSLPTRITEDIAAGLRNDPVVRQVTDIKATSLGVEQSRFKAEIDFDGHRITQLYLKEHCNLPAMLKEVKSLKNEQELEEFMVTHGDKIVDRVGDEVDRLEKEIMRKYPDIRHVDLESL